MNHTVIMDQQETDKRFMNLINQAWRHCKIGKVTHKARPVHLGWFGVFPGMIPAGIHPSVGTPYRPFGEFTPTAAPVSPHVSYTT